MTDELTPEERDALKNLPRERMPSAGLEDRVVGAMRQRGILTTKRPGRVVRITTGRVAGLMAACLVLMVGAYSLGHLDLRRGATPVRDDAMTEIEGTTLFEPARKSAPADQVESPASTPPGSGTEPRAQAPAEAKKKDQAAEETGEREKVFESTDLRKDESPRTTDEGFSAGRIEDKASVAEPQSAKRANQPPAPAAQMFARESVAPSTVLQRTFEIGGTTFIVEAPDSVRIVEDAAGRMLLIYTSDGLIRIRLAD